MDMFTEDTLGVYPEHKYWASSSVARCLMFYDWEKPVGPEWLGVAAEIFSEFGQAIFEGTGNLGERHSHGRFSRVQKKLSSFLGANPKNSFDIRLRSQPSVEKDAFFPCDVEMVLGVHESGRKEGAVIIRELLSDSGTSLVERIGDKLFSATGATYANAFDFPTLFGPASYQASICAIPRGMSSLSNKSYRTRITQWRDNRWRGLLTSQGYLREIYPINFVLRSHLNMPFRGRPLLEYMKTVGMLEVSIYCDQVYRWVVSEQRLETVRRELESSGLVLSSNQPPLLSS